jgi:predicted CxxxxCH...CXXCH cytochrome family protein
MQKQLLLLLLCGFSIYKTSSAQTPDWSTSIAAIIYNNCASCHHAGIAPFELMNYQDAVINAADIEDVVPLSIAFNKISNKSLSPRYRKRPRLWLFLFNYYFLYC